MPRHIGDHRTFEAGAHVVPADLRPCDVRGAVEAVSTLGREVDAADERDAIVDHDRLLVMAVQRPLPRVEATLDRIALAESLLHLLDLAA